MAEGHGSFRVDAAKSLAVVAQLVERVLGKDEVTSSILVNGSRVLKYFLYVLHSVPTGKYYIGIAADVEQRLAEHNEIRALDQLL